MVRTAVLIGAVAVAAYLNGLHGDWLDDDPLAIVNNADAHCGAGVAVWSNDFWGTPMSSADSHLVRH